MSTKSDAGRGPQADSAHRVQIDWDRREPVSFTVQSALSEVEGRPSTELDPLADYVDPDALEAFFSGKPTELAARTLTFEYEDHRIHVDGTGQVVID
jgi:hypothetical protein